MPVLPRSYEAPGPELAMLPPVVLGSDSSRVDTLLMLATPECQPYGLRGPRNTSVELITKSTARKKGVAAIYESKMKKIDHLFLEE